MRILRRVGWALVIVGIADIGLMVYCVLQDKSYSSSLNVFAVVAGAFLMRGSLAAARIVTWASAFLFSGFIGALVFVFPFMQPLDLWLTEFRLNPGISFLTVLAAILSTAFLGWVYLQMRSQEVIAARAEAGQVTTPPKRAFVLGAVLAISIATIMHFTFTGSSAVKAIAMAESQLGPHFLYHVQRMSWAGEHGSATVTAYNRTEIRSVEVKW
jgi:hypothetical protein